MLFVDPLEGLVIAFVILLEILIHRKQVLGVKAPVVQDPCCKRPGHPAVAISKWV